MLYAVSIIIVSPMKESMLLVTVLCPPYIFNANYITTLTTPPTVRSTSCIEYNVMVLSIFTEENVQCHECSMLIALTIL